MRVALQVCFWGAGLVLQVLVIQALLRGAYKRHFLLLVYCIAVFLTTVAEVSGFTAATRGAREIAQFVRVYYWTADVVLQALVYVLVISLIGRSLRYRDSAPAVRRLLVPAAVAIFVVSFFCHQGSSSRINEWMALVSRDLSFVAAIFDLILWFLLIAAKKKDYQLLMVSGGLGIQFTGEAVGQSVGHLAMHVLHRNRAVALAGGSLVAIANLLCFFVWWQAFRKSAPDS